MRCWSIVLLLASGVALAAPAQPPPRDAEQEKRFAAELAATDGSLPARFARATSLLDAGKVGEAEQELRAIATQAPQHAPTLWRLSSVVRLRGDATGALALARQSLAAKPSAWQAKMTVVEALLAREALSEAEAAEARRLTDEVVNERPTPDGHALSAMLAVKRNDLVRLQSSVDELTKLAPTSLATHYFTFINEGARGRMESAAAALERAVAAGLPPEEAARFRELSGINAHQRTWRYARIGGVSFAAWVLGLVAIFLIGRSMSARTLAAVERARPEELPTRTRALRRAYAGLIGAAAIYYYVSIPFVIAVVLLSAGGVFYAFVLLGWIPIKLTIVIALGALISIWVMLKSLLVRRGKEEDPGRPLREEEAPGLWRMLREVAGRVGTRPVDRVYVTPGTEIAVTERGSLARRMRDSGQRSLILGIGVLEGMNRQQLRAILAHEYGHFSNRDTAGGGLAMTVQASLLRSILGVAQSGGASLLNPAWHFLRLFYALFLRVTLGASRLQEIMADQFAAISYGSRAFVDGLRHVVRRSLEFDRNVNLLAEGARTSARPIASLYATPDGAASAADDLEKQLTERMSDAGSPYDSHPPPGKRIDWVTKLPAVAIEEPSDGDDTTWSLFSDRPALESEMTALANRRLDEQGLFESPS